MYSEFIKKLRDKADVFENNEYPMEAIVQDYRNCAKVIEYLAEKQQPKTDCSECSRRKFYQQGYQDGLNADKWIPCEERLPSESGSYLVTEKVCTGIRTLYKVGSSYFNGETWHSDFKGIYNGRKDIGRIVIAWQPLPQPYKKEGAENGEV